MCIKKPPKTKRVQNRLVYIYIKWLWTNSSVFAGVRAFSSEENKDSLKKKKKKKERIKEWKHCNYFADDHSFPGSSGVYTTKSLTGSGENQRPNSAGIRGECVV